MTNTLEPATVCVQEKKPGARRGLYLHVPFCGRRCDFCSFYQEAPDRQAIRDYLATIDRELQTWPPDPRIDTVFWGGGTPGLLTAEDLYQLGSSMLRMLGGPPAEWTVEMAPATVKEDKLAALRALGVTRLSMGVQSFDPATLEALGRVHSTKQVTRALQLLADGGWHNFNLDLMFAVPGQSLAAWEADMAQAAAARPAHISTYCLTFEDDTALWLKLQRGQVAARSEADEAAFYQRTWQRLPELGFNQYEVSNFSRPGFACQHNVDTWRMHTWYAYGPSASGQVGDLRFTRAHDLAAWSAGVAAGQPAFASTTQLSPGMVAADALVFGARMNDGVDLGAWQVRFGVSLPPGWPAFFAAACADDLLVADPQRLQLTDAGRLLVDRIGVEILELFDAA
jgi:oxygen-independent coproporphyrinogen III oxidase